jgi:zinc metalloprotease ZmpB
VENNEKGEKDFGKYKADPKMNFQGSGLGSSKVSLQAVETRRDAEGRLREIFHPPGQEFGLAGGDHISTLRAYLDQLRGALGFPPTLILQAAGGSFPQGPALVLAEFKENPDSQVAVIQQYQGGLPVWVGGLGVVLRQTPATVIAASNQFRYDVGQVKAVLYADLQAKLAMVSGLQDFLDRILKNRLLGVYTSLRGLQVAYVTAVTPLVYRFAQAERIPEDMRPSKKSLRNFGLDGHTFQLPSLPKNIMEGAYYQVLQVLFTASVDEVGQPHNFRAFIEPDSQAVLYWEVLETHVDALVYDKDPVTKGHLYDTSTPVSELNRVRDRVPLNGLVGRERGRQSLRGEYVTLTDLLAPIIAPPTTTTDFLYAVDSDEFAAVNAYYHCDRVFRMLQTGFELDVRSYMRTTAVERRGIQFPVNVDHRAGSSCAHRSCANARAVGNAYGDGLQAFHFALLAGGRPIGISTDWRVVLHEFGHAILYSHVHSANLGFCHSVGDALACILNDPGTRAGDRFATFPWSGINRRHDRAIAGGWAFGGRYDDQRYNTEQILSTALFRFYRLTGGDEANVGVQTAAAKWAVKLILDGVATLSPASNPRTPEALCNALLAADRVLRSFRALPGGHLGKVMRWSFEQQGAYQRTPTTRAFVVSPGGPPPVDLFIDDGRAGSYAPWQSNFRDAPGIWNRRAPDGGTTHQDAAPGSPNHIYVRIHNRGAMPALNARVRVFTVARRDEQLWPRDAVALTPAGRTISALASGASEVVGPFRWISVPGAESDILAIVDNEADPANDTTLMGRQLPIERLVRFDNNIALRRM